MSYVILLAYNRCSQTLSVCLCLYSASFLVLMAVALLELISSLLLEVRRSFQSERNQDILNSFISRLERATEILRTVSQSSALQDNNRDITSELQQSQDQCVALISSVLARKREVEQERFQSVQERTGQVGRPRFDVSKEQIEWLRAYSFKWVDIAELLGISISTLNRRRYELGVSDEGSFAAISDADLDSVVREISIEQPFSGIRLVRGVLDSRRIHVPRERVRMSLHRVDPVNVQLRRSILVRRRQYSVAGPNSLWHIDGNHKLIRWRFIIHGGIDGFSRLCTFVNAATNNRASTVAECFVDAAREFGWPSRVRSDYGKENVDVARLMMLKRGCNRASHITGSSVRNQRIERLWRDFFRCVGCLFHQLFHHLEDNGLLDPDNEVDLYCLQYIYLPRLNSSLERFKRGWNAHKVTTECEYTPEQLYIRGMMTRSCGNLPAVRDVFDHGQVNGELFGYDPDGPVPEIRTNNDVRVPSVVCPLTQGELQQMQRDVNPSGPCANYGISHYIATRNFVTSALSRRP